MSSPTISVVVPTYNRAHTLCRALDSVYAQTLPPDEVIVVDDGSTDSTDELIQKRYPAARYRQIAPAGVSRARNVGIELAQGQWIAFLDSDDAWLPEKLAQQVVVLDDAHSYRLCHTDEFWIRQGRRVNPGKKHVKYGGWIFQRCLPLCAISPSAALIHCSVFTEVGLFDETLPACEDYDMWLRVCARYPVLYIDQPLVMKYGGHGDQLSKHYWGMDRFRVQALTKILNDNVALSHTDRSAALHTMFTKIDILSNGARKRGNQAMIDEYQLLRCRFLPEFQKLRTLNSQIA